MKIDLIFLTHNRLDYTRLSLASILADPMEQFSLTIWDNASTDGTVEFLRKEVRDPRVKEIVFAKENIGQIAAANKVWSGSDADLLGKLDNDCIMSPGWTRTLAQAHQDIPELGVVACWHFFPEDFNLERAQHKIQQFGRHRILRHPWTCGTGLLFKRETYRRLGPLRGDGTTQYWINMAKAGHVNGFYYPLIYQEHVDDPRSKHNRSRTVSFDEAYKDSFGWRSATFRDLESYRQRHEKIVDVVLTGSYEPDVYLKKGPLQKRVWRRLKRLAGLPESL
jgi:cellulose synthase/poly-beta-1,6-N-acetylglucosamine synthase-like glycosyltransferase